MRKNLHTIVRATVYVALTVFALPAWAQDEAVFAQPPKANYPETWFHFIGGNVSREGIDADLQAIADAGISGVQWFHGHFGGAWPGTRQQIRALTPEWEELIAHLAQKADSLGLRLTIQTCPGWAMAGGPWIEPENAMRRLVWSRTDVEGAGLKGVDGTAKIALPVGKPSAEDWRDYRDICVLAFPTPLGDTGEPLRPVNVRSEEAGWAEMIAGGWQTATGDGVAKYRPVSLPAGSEHRFTFTLPEGAIIRTLELPSIGNICYNDVYDPAIHICLTAELPDGSSQTLVDANLPKASWQHSDGEIFLACNEIGSEGTAPGLPRYTLTIRNAHPSTLPYLRFWSAACKNNWRGEAGWALIAKESSQEHAAQDPRAYLHPEDIRDLSDRLSADGVLSWDAPEGHWTILRLGHVNLGRRNGPAPPEATGWECNKLDPRGASVQFAHYVGALQDGPLGGRADGMLMDSWECQTQTWTAGMEDAFACAAGYPLRSWLPALAGYVIGDQNYTSQFLIDWRRTLTELYCENFFRRMTDLAHEKGLTVQYETAGGDVVTMDPMEYYKYADTPMCEFWQPITEGFVGDLDFKPIRPTASAAHLYGKSRVAAESFTSFELTWDEHWQMLREAANLNMGEGVTHCVFHTYTHNPQVGFLPPGTSFGSAIGTPFLRGQTWWRYMPLFTAFLARQSYMLEAGQPVKEILWYLGDEVGHRPYQYTGKGTRQTGPYRIPDGFDYDYCNPDILLHRLEVRDGRICTPEGLSYEVLWIPENERMLPETVERLTDLVRAGARVIASPPISPATLSGGEAGAERFERAVRGLWGRAREGRITRLGKGFLAVGMSLEEALQGFRLRPHLICSDPDLIWSEHAADGARWFFLAAPVGGSFHGEVRVAGARGRRVRAEWWDPVDGSVRPLELKRRGRYRSVRIDLVQAEGGFLVLRRDRRAGGVRNGADNVPFGSKSAQNDPNGKKNAPLRTVASATGRDSVALTDWTIRFPQGWGAPTEPLAIPELKAWKDLDLGEEGRAFSGTATYEARFTLPDGRKEDALTLDLGQVDFIAEVRVNGQEAGVRWTPPYRFEIGPLVRAGSNTLEIDVTSTWFNRLAYDAAQPESRRKTWTISGPAAGAPLRPSGLLGPVVLY